MANIGPANTPGAVAQIERGFPGWEVGIRKGHVSIEMDKKLGVSNAAVESQYVHVLWSEGFLATRSSCSATPRPTGLAVLP